MKPEVTDKLAEARDFYTLTKTVLTLCEPYGPVHAFRFIHNRGAARVACLIELESTRDQFALARALGGRTINGAVCVEVDVRRDFEARPKVAAIAPKSPAEERIAAR